VCRATTSTPSCAPAASPCCASGCSWPVRRRGPRTWCRRRWPGCWRRGRGCARRTRRATCGGRWSTSACRGGGVGAANGSPTSRPSGATTTSPATTCCGGPSPRCPLASGRWSRCASARTARPSRRQGSWARRPAPSRADVQGARVPAGRARGGGTRVVASSAGGCCGYRFDRGELTAYALGAAGLVPLLTPSQGALRLSVEGGQGEIFGGFACAAGSVVMTTAAHAGGAPPDTFFVTRRQLHLGADGRAEAIPPRDQRRQRRLTE